MHWRKEIAGLAQAFSILLLFGIGLFFICLPFATELRFRLAFLLETDPDSCIFVGIAFLAFSLLLMLGFFAGASGRFLFLRMGGCELSIDAKILQKTIAPSLQKQFAGRIALTEIEVGQGKNLTLTLATKQMQEKEREILLLQAERHLETILAERFGYRKQFDVVVKD